VVSVAPNPSSAGHAINLTAIATLKGLSSATPGGTVTFTVNGSEQSPVNLATLNGVDQATLTLHGLSAGTFPVSASYSGDANFGSSRSLSPISFPVLPASSPSGPRVTAVHRYCVHAQPTSFVISFNGPLDAASAEDSANYHVVGPLPVGRLRRHIDPVLAAHYDSSSETVTLLLRRRLNVHFRDQLTFLGATSSGVSNPAGVRLDGAGTSGSATDFVATITRANLAGPARNRPAPARHKFRASKRTSALSRPAFGHAAVTDRN
jgi:hypothetical protein